MYMYMYMYGTGIPAVNYGNCSASVSISSQRFLFFSKKVARKLTGSVGRSRARACRPCSNMGATVWSRYCRTVRELVSGRGLRQVVKVFGNSPPTLPIDCAVIDCAGIEGFRADLIESRRTSSMFLPTEVL